MGAWVRGFFPADLTRIELESLLDRTMSWWEVALTVGLAVAVALASYKLFELYLPSVANFFLCIPIAAYVKGLEKAGRG